MIAGSIVSPQVKILRIPKTRLVMARPEVLTAEVGCAEGGMGGG
jgi:hypothetical protein